MADSITFASIKGTDDLLIVSADRKRAVRVSMDGVATLVGKYRHEIRKRDILFIAPELLIKPTLAYGRFEACEEMYDVDRAHPQLQSGEETEPWVDRDVSDEWKQQGDELE